ncbi:MAG: HXXEE domain-containing protein [Candidatus Sulfotelmatobacter sp.]
MDTTTLVFLWLFASLFMVHEFEEVVLVGAWKKRNMVYSSTRNSKLTPYWAFVSTASFSCGVAEEWLLLLGITAAALFFRNYFLWYGMLFAFTLHLVVLHLILGSFFRRYVPGVVTAALFLLPSLLMLFYAARGLHYGWQTILLSALTGTIIAGVNLWLMHRAMPVFAHWLDQFASER